MEKVNLHKNELKLVRDAVDMAKEFNPCDVKIYNRILKKIDSAIVNTLKH